MLSLDEAEDAELALRLVEAAVRNVEIAARALAAISHGNLAGPAYRRREELLDTLRDAITTLDAIRSKPAI